MKTLLLCFAGVAWTLACGCSGGGGSSAPSDTGGSATTAPASSSSGSGGGGGSGGSGGGSSSSGSGGSAGADAGASVGCNGILYCEDFETYATGAIANGSTLGPWKTYVAGLTMAVDEVKPYSGSKSLHIKAAAGGQASGWLGKTVTTGLVPGNDMFGRAMVYFSNTGGDGPPFGVHSWIFNASGTSTAANGTVSMNLGGTGAAGTARYMLNYHPATGSEQAVQAGMWTAGQWLCVQWQYNGSGTPVADDAKVWIDGQLIVEAPPSKGWSFATPWSTFQFGFTHYQTTANGVEFFLDDFALDDTMVACPP